MGATPPLVLFCKSVKDAIAQLLQSAVTCVEQSSFGVRAIQHDLESEGLSTVEALMQKDPSTYAEEVVQALDLGGKGKFCVRAVQAVRRDRTFLLRVSVILE